MGVMTFRPGQRLVIPGAQVFAPRVTSAAASGILDGISNVAAAYSLRKLRSAYSGSAVRVRRSSDSTEQDIGFASDGEFDSAAFSAFVGGGTGYVKTWYDQSGNGRDATQTTAGRQPQLVLSVFNSKTVIRASSASSHFLVATNAIPNTIANTIFSVSATSANQIAGAALVKFGENAAGKRRSHIVWDPGSLSAKYYFSGYAANISSSISASSTQLIFSTVTRSDGNTTVYTNGINRASGSLSLSSYTDSDLYIFSTSPSSEFLMGDIAEIIVFNDVLLASNHNTIGGNMATRYGLSWTTVT